MKTIVIDAGHGGSDPGATYQGSQEKTFNLSIALNVQRILSQNYEVEIVMTRTSDVTLSLGARTQLANQRNADFFLSIHNNAAGGSGFESYIYNGPLVPTTQAYQNTIHDRIINTVGPKYNVSNRGKKEANFHVLRESDMSALLLEILFVDNPGDLALLKNSSFINDVSRSIAEGVADALNLPEKTQPQPAPGDLYRVIAGSFRDRENAENRIEFLANQGIASFVVQTTISGTVYYRVQAGAYAQEKNAKDQVARLKSIGITGAFIVRETGTTPPTPAPEPPQEEGYSILGDQYLNACQLDDFVKTINPDAPDLGRFYMKYGNAYGIRGDIAYAQAIHETDYFRFTGLVDADQNNYAGIGATGPGNPGATFSSPEEGVHAQIQHLYAYASTEAIPAGYAKVDPRFDLVSRGSGKTWIQLNGKWAVPGTTYGQSILSIYERNIDHAIEEMDQQKQVLQDVLEEL
ncbi:N-acetylmuramoyl-L-alanine amidase [Halobacillus litoralis]|uniref:N-acetylmuramoyl-L-alanine amidase n=1 Tax=Halobacillus litoralis TaxID=45668 RepID=UPI0024925880|nr:N-acetylmuramoyl-L-alanine amidase [Halobacillus litoralis]